MRSIPSPPGQRCTNPRGCDRLALSGRWVCQYHADDLERRGRVHAEVGGRRARRWELEGLEGGQNITGPAWTATGGAVSARDRSREQKYRREGA